MLNQNPGYGLALCIHVEGWMVLDEPNDHSMQCGSQSKHLKHTPVLVASLVLVNRVFIQRLQVSQHATTDSLLKVSGISHSYYYYIQE